MDRLPGFRDFFPQPLPGSEKWSAALRQAIFKQWRESARRYGFSEYDGPPLEPLELFTLKSGEEIVGQLYHFTDQGDRQIALRPEMTPTLARLVSNHARNYKKPIKWFSLPQLFRYEKSQKGRLREHFQFNADILGEASPAADAELIALLIDTLRGFGLTAADFGVRLSSRNAWQEFYDEFSGSGGHPTEFFQVIDKLEREQPEVSAQRLQAMGFSLDQVKEFIEAAKPTEELRTILDHLTARGLAEFVRVDYHIIRGLAYYTGTVFEAFDQKGEFRAIAGGGRYDHLIELVSRGKVSMPALGFGMGDVVLAELLRSRSLLPKIALPVQIFCLIEEESLRAESLGTIQRLRESGWAVDYPLVPQSPGKQFKRARELEVMHTFRLAKNDQGNIVVILKNLAERTEVILEIGDFTAHLSASIAGQHPAYSP